MTSAIAAIHTGCKQLGIDEDGRRAIYERVTGKPSLTLMSSTEKDAVVTELRRLGFSTADRRPGGRRQLTGKYAKKLQALWIAAWNLGVVPDADDAALIGFVKRQTPVDDVRFVHHWEDARAVIEAIKARMKRDARVDWSNDRTGTPWANLDAFKIASAQWAILCPNGASDFWPVVTDLIDRDETHRNLTSAEWITVMNELGKRVRAARKAGK
ncbi:uncharacterized protein DUF1018 [Rhizobium subbaraonis]|uniref:Uncharacterized protein DUF1018 n=1 Tax=Rhizobium subbaraonis TaxID=908946 RepID=A0A285UXQ8_9HYPH|nr:regulatory protein GemA [Rhizobium subbaraonis]SOC46622.1 uncharacterized protein DUF1018 [Rhizobium subbaraonis]